MKKEIDSISEMLHFNESKKKNRYEVRIKKKCIWKHQNFYFVFLSVTKKFKKREDSTSSISNSINLKKESNEMKMKKNDFENIRSSTLLF